MIKEYFHIAHLISRHLSGEVTPEESRFLDKWRKESKSHEQLFQKICSDEHYAQHEIRKMEFDSQAGWKGVETRIKRMELRRRHLKLLRYVALFIAPVLILVFAFQDISVPHVMDGNQLLAAQQILPGGAKACRVEPKLFLHWIMGKRFIWMRMPMGGSCSWLVNKYR